MDLPAYLKSRAKEVDDALRAALPPASEKPSSIHRAMRYSVFAGGKRLRPILCLAACEACGGDREYAMPLACAVECLHTYSLVHDDLPCMDNDDFRRGRPTSHKVFGEGMAVLAGDALLTFAFELAAGARPSRRFSAGDYVRELAVAAGSRQLIAGQAADLEAEGKKPSRTMVRFIHERKTAAMLVASLRLGGMAAGATEKKLSCLTEFGYGLGLAFQIIDDILDVTQSSEKLGKSAGKDVGAGKMTYPAVYGLERSRREAEEWTHRALDALVPLGSHGEILRAIGAHLLEREF